MDGHTRRGGIRSELAAEMARGAARGGCPPCPPGRPRTQLPAAACIILEDLSGLAWPRPARSVLI
ncbi:hypothetical protein IBTHAUMO2_730008 [Nitrosopumilaceae archaeon]|nr:hypothetical protein IBTHAUMO2_730008 [Nitrosopumilaceae archaeon]